MDWGLSFKKLDYWGCISGARRKSGKVITSLHHLLANSAEFNQLAKEKSDKETASVQGGKGLTLAKKKKKKKTSLNYSHLHLIEWNSWICAPLDSFLEPSCADNTAHGDHVWPSE